MGHMHGLFRELCQYHGIPQQCRQFPGIPNSFGVSNQLIGAIESCAYPLQYLECLHQPDGIALGTPSREPRQQPVDFLAPTHGYPVPILQ